MNDYCAVLDEVTNMVCGSLLDENLASKMLYENTNVVDDYPLDENTACEVLDVHPNLVDDCLCEDVSRNYDKDVSEAIGQACDDVGVMRLAAINSDLNDPPQKVVEHAYYCEALLTYPTKFFNTSLEMGCSFVDTVPMANMVGCGTAIKKILMEPYAAGPLSLICHRIGKTIYIDNYNFTLKEKGIFIQEKSQRLPQTYCSDDDPTSTFSPQLSLYENLIWNSAIIPCCSKDKKSSGNEIVVKEQGIASKKRNLEFPKMFNSYSYRITAQTNPGYMAHIWEFHDYRMLVDLDLPIFGCGKFPSVSIHIRYVKASILLRLLNEETKPISVLTGIDVLLDQLICNLSETILVHHEKGLVKEYEVLVKEEIPHIVGSEFDPSNLKNITENIMSFLSKNMTEQGHTYWLFRERGSSLLKLYDLTSICPDLACVPNCNPFLVPVITLLYKLSTDLIDKSPSGRPDKLSNVIYGLLTAAAKLADNENLAEMKACIHYSLAGVYLMYGLREDSSRSYSYIMKGLKEVVRNGGYPRITSTIKVESLKRRSICDGDLNAIPYINSGSKRPPYVRLQSECAEQALEHCLQSLNAMERIEIDSNRKCPFRPDGADDVAAVSSISRKDPCASRRLLRHSVLLRAASAYLSLVNQALNLSRTVKCYNFSRCGITLCGVILSTNPQAHHAAVCYALISCFLSTFIHSATKRVEDKMDHLLNNPLSYRDRRILELATQGVSIEGILDCSAFWFGNNYGEVRKGEWLKQIEAAIDRFCLFLKEYPNSHNNVAYPPIVSIIAPESNICRVAMSVMMMAGMYVASARGEINLDKEFEDDEEEHIRIALDFVTNAKRLYHLALDLLDPPDNSQTKRCQTIVYANRLTALRLEYTIMVAMKGEPVTSAPILELVDQICGSYRKIFALLNVDIETQDGGSVYINSLLDFGCALMVFADHLKYETDAQYKDRRVNFLEAAVRALRDVYSKKVFKGCRSKASQKIVEAYYTLLAIKSETIITRPEITTIKSQRSLYKEMADILLMAQNHLIHMSHEDLSPESKNVSLDLTGPPIMLVSVKFVSDSTRIQICKQMLEWCLGLTSNVHLFESDKSKAMEYYRNILDRVQCLLKTMNQEWRNNATMKAAYLHVLVVLPDSPSATRALIMKSIKKAIESLGGNRQGNSHWKS